MKKPKKLQTFVANKRSRILHKFPAFESCNLDAVKEKFREYFGKFDKAYDKYHRLCIRCFGK